MPPFQCSTHGGSLKIFLVDDFLVWSYWDVLVSGAWFKILRTTEAVRKSEHEYKLCIYGKERLWTFMCKDLFIKIFPLACSTGLCMDWRWLAICSSIPPTLLMVAMCFMPETPRFLLSQGKRREAEEALRFLRGPDAPVEWECARIEDTSHEQVRLLLVG